MIKLKSLLKEILEPIDSDQWDNWAEYIEHFEYDIEKLEISKIIKQHNLNYESYLKNAIVKLYDKTTSLELGTLCYNNKYFSYAINIYKNYLHKYSYIDESNLHVINYIKKYFEKCVIIEQLKKIKDKKTYLVKEILDTEQKVNL